MGKGDDGEEVVIWDDTALVKAFDNAIATYKKMHSKGGNDDLVDEVNATKVSFPVEESEFTSRHVEASHNTAAELEKTTEIRDTTNPLVEENRSDPYVPEQCVVSLNGQCTQDSDNCLGAQGNEEYNNLLHQYNELEEQRQKILAKLYQCGGWNYQDYGCNAQWNTYASQEHQAPAAQSSCPTSLVCSCPSYVCPFPTATGKSSNAGTICVGNMSETTSAVAHNGSSLPVENGDFVKAATSAAETAIRSLKAGPSGIPNLNKEKEANKDEETEADHEETETDISVVLNAWFSAGFYTGKYLTEQSFAKKRSS